MARFYRMLPIKPFGHSLKRLYFKMLNSSEHASVIVKKIDGIGLELDLREVIDSEMYYGGSPEPETSKTLEILCKPGDIVIDIGANVGSHALPIARLVGNQGRVHAFEPVPWAMAKMKRNISLNGFANLITEQLAVSDENLAQVEMELPSSFKIGAARGVDESGKIDEGWWSECDKVLTKIQTLDSYIAENAINRVDLIKLDVDGFEGKVIRGTLDALSRFRPLIIMELGPAWLEMRCDSCLAVACQLRELGYRCFEEVTFDEILDPENLILEIPPGRGVNVVFAVETPTPKTTQPSSLVE